jgi:ClpP class serine protease
MEEKQMEALHNRISEHLEQTVALDEFEQAIEDGAEYFVPVSSAEQDEIEAIIAAANATQNVNIDEQSVLKSMQLLRY